LKYSEKYNIPLPNKEQLHRMIKRSEFLTDQILYANNPSDESLQGDKSNKNDDNLTEPHALISGLLFSTALRKTHSKKRESSKCLYRFYFIE
jgi:hypothetical protein